MRKKLKKSQIYVPDDLNEALDLEAQRLGRSVSWVVRQCVKVAMVDLQATPPDPDAPRGRRYTPRESSVSHG